MKGRLIILLFFLLAVPYILHRINNRNRNFTPLHKFSLYRDSNGIPRVVGRDKKAIFYGMGYAQAQDRLWVLYVKKFMAAGRLAQLFGSEALEMDLELRNFNFYNSGKMNLDLVDPQSKELIQAYTNGINDYAHQVKVLPFQFYVTWVYWQDWTMEDSLAQLAFFSFCLEYDWLYQIVRQRLYETVGFDLAIKLIPFGQENLFRETTIINDEQVKEQGRYQHYNSDEIEKTLKEHWTSKTMPIGSVSIKPSEYDRLGSNGWAISGDHTFHGKPIIANDPHLNNIIPSLFYMMEVILVDENNDVVNQAFGVMVNGVPSITLGVNKHVSWASTASYIDNKDLFHEKVRENDGDLQYQYNGQWKQFTKRKEVFKVRGSQTFVKQFYHTHRGPVLEHIFYKIHFKFGFPIPNKYRVNHTVTISAAIYTPDNSSYKGLLDLGFVQSAQKLIQVGNLIKTPNIDASYIDQKGNMGFLTTGRIPKRNVPEMGSFMKDGSTDYYDMKEFLTSQEKIYLKNPKKGYIAMANNKIVEDSFDWRFSIHQQSTGRAYRIEKMITDQIKEGKKFTFDDIKRMQLDTRDQFLSQAFPSILKALERVPELWRNAQTQILFQKLLKWDYNLSKESIEASIYHVWQHQFQQSLLQLTQLTPKERQAVINHAFFQFYMMKLFIKIGEDNLGQEERIVCENTWINGTEVHHPCLTNVALVFRKLPQLLTKIFQTSKIEEWKWGKIHEHQYKSTPFSQIPILKNIWGRSIPAGGNSRTVNVGITTHQTNNYHSHASAIFRFISDLNRTVFTYDTGESANIFSEYYDNFVGRQEYIEYVRRNPLKQQVDWKLQLSHL